MSKISVIIPTYNSEKYIESSIKSILKQTYNDFEIIICDNISKDKTISIIKNLTKKNQKQIKIFTRKDTGVADALNFGFKKAKGDILCWLNSDDMFNHKFVFKEVKDAFEKNHKKYYLAGNFINVNKYNHVIKHFYSFIPFRKMKKFFFYNQIFTGSFFFRKQVFKTFKKFNPKYKYAFEYEILIHALKKFEGIYLNNFLCRFRILPNALSSNKLELKNEFLEILKKNNLKYSNSLFFRLFIYIKQKIFFEVVKNKIKF